jgi:hypothetical protein
MGLLQERARVFHPEPSLPANQRTPRAMDLSSYASATTSNSPISPRPKGHVWSTRLCSWVVPILRKNSRRPSPQHIHCSEPPCWVLIEPLDPEAAAS